jgi:phosphate:Na+ symporter
LIIILTGIDLSILDIFKVIGSLALFIYGMKVMSEGVQRAAGSRLRKILSAMTANRFKGLLTGLATTSILQSSSATTVMLVSFVNAGMLKLREAIPVILGANIGTTVTAWLVAFFAFGEFSISSLSLPLLALGMPLLFIKRSNFKYLGEFLIGFALLFLGLQMLQFSLPDFEESPDTFAFLANFSGPGYASYVLFFLVGIAFTGIIQSSSAAIALIIALIAKDIIDSPTAAAMVLGCNVGTTITANLAALVANVHAKRSARSHFLFNLLGSMVVLAVFPFYMQAIAWLFEPVLQFVQGINPQLSESREALFVSFFHTSFNVFNAGIFIFAVPVLEKLSVWMVPSKGGDDVYTLEYIGSRVMTTPELAMMEVDKETLKFANITTRMSGFVIRLLEENDAVVREEIASRVQKYEAITDKIEVEIANFLAKMSSEEMAPETSIKVRSILSISSDLERIADIFFQMSMTLESKYRQKIYFLPKQRDSIKNLFAKVDEAFELMLQNIQQENQKVNLKRATEIENEINALRDEIRKKHLSDVEKGKYSVQSGMIYNDLFSSLEKIGDHIINVSEAAAGQV